VGDKPINLQIPQELLAQQGRHLDKERRRAEIADLSHWLNIVRFRIKTEMAAAPSIDSFVAMKEDRSALDMTQKPPYVDVAKPAVVEVPFRREAHACPIHLGETYFFWRCAMPFDAQTPPVCTRCIADITPEVLKTYLKRRDWTELDEGWASPDSFGLAHELLTVGKEHEALVMIALGEEKLVEAVIGDLMPPAAPCAPLWLLASNEEVHAIAEGERHALKEMPLNYFGYGPGIIPRTSGVGAFKAMRDLGFDERDLRRLAWRTVKPLTVPASYIEARNAQFLSRVIEGEVCRMSVQIIKGAMKGQDMNCGFCNTSVQLLEHGIVPPHHADGRAA